MTTEFEIFILIVALMIAPLYGTTATILWRLGKVTGHRRDIESNEDSISKNLSDIHSIQRTLAALESDVSDLKKDNEMLHDLLAEHNHCGSPNCRFCDGSPPDD